MRISTRFLHRRAGRILAVAVFGSIVGLSAVWGSSIGKADPPITHANKKQTYNENPAPRLPGNPGLASVVPQQVVVGKLPSNVRLISAQLKVYKDYLNQEHDKDIFTEVSPDQIVWVVKKSYPDGLDTRGGFFINAVRTEVFDAQMGEFISATTTGDGKKKTGSHV